jgi:hypothetical protein
VTATTAAPVRPAPVRPPRSAPLSFLRLLRIELRRNPIPLILPLIAALFWFDSYRVSTAPLPFWVLRTFWNMGQGNTIIDFGPFVAGMAAWIGSREGRRGTSELATTTVRARWTAQLATWAATVIWALASYVVFVGVMFGVYARQGVGGQPPWWWVAVGVTAVAAFSAAGFAVGVLWPSRYAAPLAAFGGFLALMLSAQIGFRSHGFPSHAGWALILPTNSNGNYERQDAGIFYPYLPDLPIARIIFLAGILAAFLGLLGLPARAGGRWLRGTAAAVTLVGVAAVGTAVGLATTAQLSSRGTVIPLLHDAADDRPIAFTPVCGNAGQMPVCLNPAYGRYLSDVTAALAPVAAEVADVNGAPVRVTQVADDSGDIMTISGSPAVLLIPLGADPNLPGGSGCHDNTTAQQFANILRAQFVHAFVTSGTGDETPAQQAVQAALLQRIGIPFADQPLLEVCAQARPGPKPGPGTGPVYDAAQRLVALPATARYAWLNAHLAALRSGALTLEQLP